MDETIRFTDTYKEVTDAHVALEKIVVTATENVRTRYVEEQSRILPEVCPATTAPLAIDSPKDNTSLASRDTNQHVSLRHSAFNGNPANCTALCRLTPRSKPEGNDLTGTTAPPVPLKAPERAISSAPNRDLAVPDVSPTAQSEQSSPATLSHTSRSEPNLNPVVSPLSPQYELAENLDHVTTATSSPLRESPVSYTSHHRWSVDSKPELALPPAETPNGDPARSDIDKVRLPSIVKAARDGLPETLIRLLANGALAHQTECDTNRTALIEATRMGRETAVEILLQSNCAIDHNDSQGLTALHHAVVSQNYKIAELLLAKNARVDIMDGQGLTPLDYAVNSHDDHMVSIFRRQCTGVQRQDSLIQMPLRRRSTHGSRPATYQPSQGSSGLLTSGQTSSRSLNPSAGEVNLEALQLSLSLLKPSVNNPQVLSALFAAIEAGQIEAASMLFESGVDVKRLKADSYKPATLAAKSGSSSVLDLVIEKGCSLKDKDPQGWKPLHYAARYGHSHCMTRIVAEGVSVKSTTNDKETALHLAAIGGHAECAAILLIHDKKLLSTKDSQDQDALHLACRTGNTGLVRLLLDKGAKMDTCNAYGWQPLHIATAYGHLAIVHELVSRAAGTETKVRASSFDRLKETHGLVKKGHYAETRWPHTGSRPLHLAAEFNRNDIAAFLLERSVKADVADAQGWRPLHHAAFNSNARLVETLLGVHQANPHALTNSGKTAPIICDGAVADGFKTSIARDEPKCRELLRAAASSSTRRELFGYAFRNDLMTFKSKTAEDKNRATLAALLATSLHEPAG